MKINYRIAQFFQLLGIIVLLWSVFLVARFFLERNSDSVLFSPPKSADISINIDGNELVNSILFSTFIEQKDPDVARKLRKLLSKNDNSSERKSLFIGVDAFQTFQLFSDHSEGKRLNGIIVKIDAPKLWDANASSLFGKNSFTIRNENSGLILTSSELNKSDLSNYYTKNKSSILRRKVKLKMNNLVEYHQTFPLEEGSVISKVSSEVNLLNNSLKFKGSIIPTDNLKLEDQRYQLKSKDLSMNGRILPKLWNDALYDFCAKNLDSLPTIHSFSLNYKGLELTTTANQVLPLPSMELIVTFKESFNLVTFVKNVIAKRDVDVEIFEDYLKIGDKIYYFKQLDANSIYLGITNNPQIEKVKNESVLSIKGNPKALINVKGSRFVTAMIKMSDTYKAFETLFSQTENISLEVNRTNRKKLDFKGEFRFETGKNATNEFLKFMLAMKSNL